MRAAHFIGDTQRASRGVKVLVGAVLLCVVAMNAPASAKAYFCDLSDGIETGKFRPEDASDELAITVRPQADQQQFWFDDVSGDYQSYASGVISPVEHGSLPLPLDQLTQRAVGQEKLDPQELAVFLALADNRRHCVETRMGQLPAGTENSTP